jgi:hypothetical protein
MHGSFVMNIVEARRERKQEHAMIFVEARREARLLPRAIELSSFLVN